jgi:hypothetical protein
MTVPLRARESGGMSKPVGISLSAQPHNTVKGGVKHQNGQLHKRIGFIANDWGVRSLASAASGLQLPKTSQPWTLDWCENPECG